MRKLFILIASILLSLSISAQGIAVWIDQFNDFYVFDNGRISKLEHQLVEDYEVGDNFVAYIDVKGEFRFYYNGKSTTLFTTPPSVWGASATFLYYTDGAAGVIIKDGSKKVINNFAGSSTKFDDDLLAYIDRDDAFKVHYNNREIELENVEVTSYQLANNLVAYVNRYDAFNCFVDGNTFELEAYPPKNYKVAKNIVAYVDEFNDLKVFENGMDYPEIIQPNLLKGYSVGDGFLNYFLDNEEWIYYNSDTSFTILYESPQQFEIVDNLLIYKTIDRSFGAVCNGVNYELTNYVPELYEATENIVVYTNLEGRLEALYHGKIVNISENIVETFEVFGDVIVYQTGGNDFRIYWKGKTY